jgi:hypothetical protein
MLMVIAGIWMMILGSWAILLAEHLLLASIFWTPKTPFAVSVSLSV